jgi:hypothetical protein
MAGGRLGRVRGTASAGRFPMGTAAGAPQHLTKLYLGNCARTEEAGSRSRRKRKDSHDLLEVVVELESVTEQLGHRYLVCRLPLAFAQLDPELPGAQGADADVCHLFGVQRFSGGSSGGNDAVGVACCVHPLLLLGQVVGPVVVEVAVAA